MGGGEMLELGPADRDHARDGLELAIQDRDSDVGRALAAVRTLELVDGVAHALVELHAVSEVVARHLRRAELVVHEGLDVASGSLELRGNDRREARRFDRACGS